MKVITVTNQKGGTTKTSTALYLTYGLANRGKHVLLIDLDQQADASFSMHVAYDLEATTFQVLTRKKKLEDIIVKVNDAIDLAPASSDLSQLDLQLAGKIDPQFILQDELEGVKYDYVIIDTAPAINMALLNALTASQSVVVPVQADIYSLKGLKELATTVNSIKKRSNLELKIAGILIARYNSRTVFAKAITAALEQVTSELDTTVFNSKIREATSVKESQNAFQSIFEYDPKGKVTEDINAFIDEFLEKEN